jgi:hypothetical protein
MNITRADGIMSRILFIDMTPATPQNYGEQSRQAENALTLSLAFSGVRCLLQYALLPFLLPIVGIAADATIPILLAINVVAVVSIFFSLRRFWKIGYDRRWQYLGVASVALVLLVAFTVYDIITLQTI